MQAYAVSYSKYMIAASMVLYTFLAYVALLSGRQFSTGPFIKAPICSW